MEPKNPVISGDALPSSCSPKCSKLLAALHGRAVKLLDTGSRDNNALDKLLRCECKERQVCSEVLREYAACHSSVMSVGAHKGKANCGAELATLMDCVFNSH